MNTREIPRHIPWWVHLLLAIAAYVLLKYVLPQIDGLSPNLKGIAEQLAPIITIVFLVLAGNGLYRFSTPETKGKDDEPTDDTP